MTPHAVILDGVRTPFGKFGGSLKDLDPTALGTLVTKALLARHERYVIDTDEVVFGNVIPASGQSIYMARHIALSAGLRQEIGALAVNRLCGSGLESIIQCARNIQTGESDVGLAGGVESMTHAPYVAKGARFGLRLGSGEMEDMLLTGLTDNYVALPMGRTAENLARDFKISREEQDEWAGISQTRAEAAQKSGRFKEEVIPVPMRKGPAFESDEFIKGAEGVPGLETLSPAFEKDGTVTAGNASGINDGASAVIVSSEAYATKIGKKPLAKIIGWGTAGCDPSRMGIGPVYAVPKALKMAGISQSDVDLFEINEAFAAQTLAVMKGLKLDGERTNVNGGAIALGHPLGASGNRVALTLAIELHKRDARYGVASLCIGGGQGIAIVLEKA
ncbi:MAG: acetyl-CoA C-acetyltransferase [Spirochaetia bacterium]|nr:acetyl-CoA C-acetyltransferase [Spirochaetia bacterium]